MTFIQLFQRFDGGYAKPEGPMHPCNGICGESLEECPATWDQRLPLPEGWQVARCVCGRPVNEDTDINLSVPAVICPNHTQVYGKHYWGCPNCHRGARHISLSPASELREDGWFDPLPELPPERRILVVFNGRSVAGILADARRVFPDVDEVIVVTRDNDDLPPPEGVPACPVSEFQPIQTFGAHSEIEYLVVANGGTTQQQAPVLLRIGRSKSNARVFDLQRDGAREILI